MSRHCKAKELEQPKLANTLYRLAQPILAAEQPGSDITFTMRAEADARRNSYLGLG
ncbi:hypothetical protein D3C77_664520 [compost metagenome]